MSTDSAPSAEAIAKGVERHSFAPVDNGFTVDPDAGTDGVSDLQSGDWRVRTLAARDLVRLGIQTPAPVRGLLSHEGKHVRQVAAMTLGILRDEAAADALSQTTPVQFTLNSRV